MTTTDHPQGLQLPFVDAAAIAAIDDPLRAVDALEAALADGLDAERDLAKQILPIAGGELLLMPTTATRHVAVKVLTVGGDPLIQGVCLVFDGATLAPAALVDGPALTAVRTSAVSALAVRHLAIEQPRSLLVFGRGVQAHAHVRAVTAVRPSIEQVTLVGSDRSGVDVDALVAAADVVCCCTTAREPVFDSTRLPAHATVVAVGAHHLDARETDAALVGRATVVVESRASALREAGDVVLGIEAGALTIEDAITLGELVRGERRIDATRPRLFKSTGMAWEDAVVAASLAGVA